jgi:hypothetical protein
MINDTSHAAGDTTEPLIVTYTNFGFLPTTLNWYESLRRIGLADHALVFALSRRTEHALRERGIACRLLGPSVFPECPDGFLRYRAPEWRTIVMRKLEVVGQLLGEGRTVLFSDADVVFRRNPLPYLAELAEGHELVIQQDLSPNEEENTWPGWELCTGFFYVRPTARTARLFAVDRGDFDAFTNDQPLLNARIHADGVSHHALSNVLFPNGAHWYHAHESMGDSYVVHFNWVVGNKLPVMEKYGLRFHHDDPEEGES